VDRAGDGAAVPDLRAMQAPRRVISERLWAVLRFTAPQLGGGVGVLGARAEPHRAHPADADGQEG
jgi:hypothetical protein